MKELPKVTLNEWAKELVNQPGGGFWELWYEATVSGYVETGTHPRLKWKGSAFKLAILLWRKCLLARGKLPPRSAYFTPKDLAIQMVELAQIEEDEIVLDPCAGIGVLLAVAKAYGGRPMGYEINGQLVKVSKELDEKLHIMQCDFLSHPKDEEIQFRNLRIKRPVLQPDVILMNPPIGKQQKCNDITVKFLKRCIRLYDRARVAVILKCGFFKKKSRRRDINTILREYDIEEMVALPPGILKPWLTKPMMYLLRRREKECSKRKPKQQQTGGLK